MKLNFKIDNVQKRIIFYILVIVIPLFTLTLYFTQSYVQKELEQSALQKAHIINLNIKASIEKFLEQTSEFTKKASYMMTIDNKNFQKILPFLKANIEKNKDSFGTALAIEPSSSLYQIYCKYFYKYKGFIREKYLLPPDYNYVEYDWYKKVKETQKPMWSEPYFDRGGGDVYMSTYSFPIKDLENSFLGVITVDIKLDFLQNKIQSLTKMSDGFVFLVSKSGLLLSYPNKKTGVYSLIQDFAKKMDSKTLLNAYRSMKSGENGVYRVNLKDKEFTLYTMYIPQTSWHIGVMLKNDLLFRPLEDLKTRLIFISIAGILLILFMIVIVSNQLKKSVAKEEKIKNELELASEIQQSFLPKKDTLIGENYSLSGYMKAAKEVGGDFYGYRIDGDKLLFYVGDVSGKGVPASLFMMASHMLIEETMDMSFDPAYILKKTNEKICKMSERGLFATLVVGVWDLRTNKLEFSLAGHPPFMIKDDLSLYSALPNFAPPIGVFDDIIYKNSKITLRKNSTIIVFSDGVNEAEDDKQELYGTLNLAEAFNSFDKEEDVKSIKNGLLKRIKIFTKGTEQSDDLTLLVVSSHIHKRIKNVKKI